MFEGIQVRLASGSCGSAPLSERSGRYVARGGATKDRAVPAQFRGRGDRPNRCTCRGSTVSPPHAPATRNPIPLANRHLDR